MKNRRILLKPLTLSDAASFYELYREPEVNHGKAVFLPGESAPEFTARIMAACVEIYTIRLPGDEETVIGDCALHDPNDNSSEIEIGGSLLPAFQHKGYMREAFRLLEHRAKNLHGMQFLVAKTGKENKSAIRLVEKSGYRRRSEDKGLITFYKTLTGD